MKNNQNSLIIDEPKQSSGEELRNFLKRLKRRTKRYQAMKAIDADCKGWLCQNFTNHPTNITN